MKNRKIRLLVLSPMNTKIPQKDRKFNFDTIAYKNLKIGSKTTKICENQKKKLADINLFKAVVLLYTEISPKMMGMLTKIKDLAFIAAE